MKYWADIEIHQQGVQDEARDALFDRVADLVMPFGCDCELCQAVSAERSKSIDLSWVEYGGVSGTGKDGVVITRASLMFQATDKAEANMLAGFVLDEWLLPGLGDSINGGWIKIEIEEDVDE